MSIDLSKAKVGDKFRTRKGYVVELKDTVLYFGEYVYRLTSPNAFVCVLRDGRMYKCNKVSEFDLVEQVFDDEKDRAITDKILKDVEKVTNGVADAMPLIESVAIANLPRDPLPENREENYELQRRQEVIELSEKMYIMFENETLRYHLNRDGSDKFCSENLREMAIIRAASFINKKHKYLKDGKLC
jgi:hypothetical protein